MAIELFTSKTDCCGCEACFNICSHKAITMVPDGSGFMYPLINTDVCVECGLCKKVCQFRTAKISPTENVYVAAIRDNNQIMKAASGGIFSAAALSILSNRGVIFGATLTFSEGHANPHHIMIEKEDDLWRLQGSKYVQSRVGETYQQVKQYLQQGRKVLYSGTPCQIAGLKGYLCKEYDNLYTMDLICHGVPSAELFDAYIQEKNKKYRGKVVQYRFRDKTYGWGMNSAIEVTNGRKTRVIYRRARTESYFTLFLDCKIYRENCYSCPFARPERVSDITIGDYWGIEKAHPELSNNPDYDESKGVSCVLVNTSKGHELFRLMQQKIHFMPSEFAKVAEKNGQLKVPSAIPVEREYIMDIYHKKGYNGVENYFRAEYRKQIVMHTVYNTIPRKMRLKLKKIVKG